MSIHRKLVGSIILKKKKHLIARNAYKQIYFNS